MHHRRRSQWCIRQCQPASLLAGVLVRGIIVHTIKTLGGAMMSVNSDMVIEFRGISGGEKEI